MMTGGGGEDEGEGGRMAGVERRVGRKKGKGRGGGHSKGTASTKTA